MFSDNEIAQLRKSYIEIGKLTERYGHGQYNGMLQILMGQIQCIDSDEKLDEKENYLIGSYNLLFASGGGLGDFIIYDQSPEIRNQLNEKYNNEINTVWNIIKKYI